MARRRMKSLPPLASLQAPPEIRLVNQSVMKAEWVDIDDIRPTAARTARRVNGYRSFDPLRKAMTLAGSSITIEHVLAADRLRKAADAVVIGYSGGRELVPIQALRFGPKSGPGRPALRSAGPGRCIAGRCGCSVPRSAS